MIWKVDKQNIIVNYKRTSFFSFTILKIVYCVCVGRAAAEKMVSPWAALLLLATITLGPPQHVQCKRVYHYL